MKTKIQNYEHTSDEQSNDERNRPCSTVRLFGCSVVRMFVILLGCFLCNPPAGSCQFSKVASLTARLSQSLHDTDKVNTLNELAWELMYSNPDTSIILSTQALEIATVIAREERPTPSLRGRNDRSNLYLAAQKGIGQSYHQLGVFRDIKGDYAQSLEYYARAIAIWENLEKFASGGQTSNIKQKKASTLGNIGIVYKEQGDYPKALYYYFKALKMAEE